MNMCGRKNNKAECMKKAQVNKTIDTRDEGVTSHSCLPPQADAQRVPRASCLSHPSCLLPEIKTIIFDWGGVLIDTPGAGIVSHCSRTIGVSPQAFVEAYKLVEFDFYRGTITEPQLWQRICGMAGVNVPQQCLDETKSVWFDAFEGSYRPRGEMFELVGQLKAEGYKVGLLSNTEMPSLTFFEQDIYRNFDFSVFSCVEGLAKPGAEIYHLAARRAQCPASQCVFIDDRKENIDAADAAGMKGVHFVDLNSLKQELAEMEII